MYLGVCRFLQNNPLSSLGVRLAHKLSCLEGFSALTSITKVPDRIRSKEVLILVDNAGFVYGHANKHSHCPIAKALNNVSLGLACR